MNTKYPASRLTLLLAAGILAVTLALSYRLSTEDQAKIRRTIDLQAEKVEQVALGKVPYAAPYIADMMWDWLRNGKPTEAKWKAEVKRNLQRHPACQALVWVDPSFQPRWIVAQNKAEAIRDLDLYSHPEQRALVEKARDQKEIVLLPSLDAAKIGRVVPVFVPLYRGRSFEGFFLAVFRIQEHLHTIFAEVAPGYAIVILDSHGEIYRRGEAEKADRPDLGVEKNVSFYDATWKVRIWPSVEQMAKESSPFPKVALGVGLLITLLVPSVVYFAQTARLRAAQLEAAYQSLQREIVEREQAEKALANDITERTRLEEQLRQSQKMEAIGQLAGGVAHDFNNLLTVITGYTDMLLDGLEPADPRFAPLEEIRKAGDRASSLTHQLLAFSRKQILEPKILDLNAEVADIEKMLRRVIGEHIDLVTILKGDLRPVKADPSQIHGAILNLAVNARDAMPRGGKLTIETANVNLDETYAATHMEVQPGPYVMLAVTDTGCGMHPETLARLFEPFFTTKEVGKGTGMGLATVYGIVKQSGGSIHVYSEPGQGTVFKIYLPSMGEDLSCEPAPEPAVEAPRGTETVLVVEDEEAVRGLTCEALQTSGYTVLEACRGEEAIRLCQQSEKPIHLLLTDVIMPQMSGPELATRINDLCPALKVLFVSGYTDHAIVRHGMLNRDTSFLQKPFSPAELARKVRQVLDEPAACPC
jgi:signal transduction histidine kinase/ActR/RegA family two-component response regulator